MRYILLLIQFDGTDFRGWQQQHNLRTVQECLMDALKSFTGSAPTCWASSRTDAGVHAVGLPVLFHTESTIPLKGFARGLNGHLPADIAVVNAAEVEADFHVRENAGGKQYRYTLWNARARSPLCARSAWHVPAPLDEERMQEGANAWIGEHDFSSFRASDCQSLSTIRRITEVSVERRGEVLTVTVCGNAFLQHMVRIMVGTLVDVGRGFRPPSWTAEVLAARSRPAAGPTAPPNGLCLEKVIYAPSPFRDDAS